MKPQQRGAATRSPRGMAASVLGWAWRQRGRFLRFGVVGVSGVAINQLVIWVCFEWLYASVGDRSLRLNLSMFTGIVVGMTNNFWWNRSWTWQDRERAQRVPIVHQYLQYAAANWAGILVQIALTNMIAQVLPYLVANLLGIAVASGINFVMNDLWTYRHVRTEGIDPEARQVHDERAALLLGGLGLSLALCAYIHGIGSIQAPTNGDEWVYLQITRMTAASGHWLPLVSGMEEMRNTKPPPLFWQGIASTNWGEWWNLAALRWPSLAWTFGTAAIVALLAWRISGRAALVSISAALTVLAFLGTFRFGRPFLTNAPATFWLFGAVAWVTLAPQCTARLARLPLLGIVAGIALCFRSFALLAPLLLWLALVQWNAPGVPAWTRIRSAARTCAVVAVVALAVFSLWFAVDPDPAAVWREFVVGENAGKMAGGPVEWLTGFLWGGFSVWGLAASPLLHAGLLAFPLFGVLVECWKHRRELTAAERMLLLWVGAMFLAFCIPAQRSGRYMLEAMPALAVLLATRGHHVGRNAFMLTHIGAVIAVVPIAWLSVLLAMDLGSSAFPWWHWPLLAATAGFALWALFTARWTKACAAPSALAVLLALTSFLQVFDAPLGTFTSQQQERLAQQRIWVPENFRSVAEIHRMLLPRSEILGFPAAQQGPGAAQARAGDFVSVLMPIDAPAPAGAVATRIQMASRHSGAQILEMFLGKAREHLFVREWIVPWTPAAAGGAATPAPSTAAATVARPTPQPAAAPSAAPAQSPP